MKKHIREAIENGGLLLGIVRITDDNDGSNDNCDGDDIETVT